MKKIYIFVPAAILLMALLTFLRLGIEKDYEEAEYQRQVVNRDRSTPKYNRYGLETKDTLSDTILYENAGIVIYEDRFVNKLTISETAATETIRRINALAYELGKDRQILWVPVPKRIQFEKDFAASNEIYDRFVSKVSAGLISRVKTVDLKDVLAADREHFLYYRQADDWTMDGAMLGYFEVCKALGITPYPEETFTPFQIGSFGGDLAHVWHGFFKGTELEEAVDAAYAEEDPFVFRKSFRFKDYEIHVDDDGKEQKRPVFMYSIAGASGIIGGAADYVYLYGYGEETLMLIGDRNGKLLAPYLTEHYKEVIYVNVERCTTEQMLQLAGKHNVTVIVVSQTVDRAGNPGYSRALNGLLEK